MLVGLFGERHLGRKAPAVRSQKTRHSSVPNLQLELTAPTVAVRVPTFHVAANRRTHPSCDAIVLFVRVRIALSSSVELLLALGGLDGADRFQHGVGEGALGIFVAGRIVLALGDVHGLDLSVHRVDRVALAAPDDPDIDRTGVGELNIEGLGELPLWITHELQQGQPGFLVFRPSLHYGGIIDTVDNDFFDPFLSERLLLLEVIRDLLCGSGGGERPGQTDQDDRFVLGEVGEVVLRRRKAEVQIDARELVAHGGQPAARRHRSEAKRSRRRRR
mmetsp:Transcript_2796/g.7690  ORF Transcript_2796/g.7690 Transcript_2796/m.7690 type:complete len:275 (-) Transcript_2796:213-1037(-)